MTSSQRFRIVAIGVALLLYSFPACGQIPGVGRVLKKAKDKLPTSAAVANVLRPGDPITTSLKDAVTEMPLLDGFEPRKVTPLRALSRDSAGFLLHPGAFAMDAQSYCLHAGTYAPAQGDGYLYAPLAGPAASVIRDILRSSIDHPEIPQRRIQVLIWAILAHAKIEQLDPESRQTAVALLTPLELVELNRGALDVLPQGAREGAEANMPPLIRDAFEAENRLRELLTSSSATYDQLEAVAVRAGAAPIGPGSREIPKVRWSYNPSGFFVRYLPSGYSVTHVEVYVPERVTIQRDQLNRITSVADQAGDRIEAEYDDAIPPLVVPGDDGTRGYPFKVIRFIAPDSSVRGSARRAEVRHRGWTFVGMPNGHGRIGLLPRTLPAEVFRYAGTFAPSTVGRRTLAQEPDPYEDREERYKEAVEVGKELAKMALEHQRDASDPKYKDLGDPKFFHDGLEAASKPTGLNEKIEWIGNLLGLDMNGWHQANCALAKACGSDQPPHFDPSRTVAQPGNTARQRLAQSARPH